jgi:hypothetical protein
MATEVSDCSCKFPYQDKLYGEGQRLHDLRVNSKCVPVWQCSHCSKTKINYIRR